MRFQMSKNPGNGLGCVRALLFIPIQVPYSQGIVLNRAEDTWTPLQLCNGTSINKNEIKLFNLFSLQYPVAKQVSLCSQSQDSVHSDMTTEG